MLVNLNSILASTLLVAIISSFVLYLNNSKNVRMENITKQRAQWRTTIKEISNELLIAAYGGNNQEIKLLSSKLQLNLNPHHSEDQKIVACALGLTKLTDAEKQIEEFNLRVSLLLKHDWDRAKQEAEMHIFGKKEVTRIKFEGYSSEASIEATSKKSTNSKMYFWLVSLILSSGIIFGLIAMYADAFKVLLQNFDTPKQDIPLKVWLQFSGLSLIFGIVWSAIYLWFKTSEKILVEDIINQIKS